MDVRQADNALAWDGFLRRQPWCPFLQTWTMGDVYASLDQSIVRLRVTDGDETVAQCFGHLVPERRGKHLSIPYGPVIATKGEEKEREILSVLLAALKETAATMNASFLRMSPFWETQKETWLRDIGALRSPLHLLAEHLWILPLKDRTEDELLMGMRKTTRNLVRRAEKEGVVIEASQNPEKDVEAFIRLHEETRSRHQFTPYRASFFRAQLAHFSRKNEATLYFARYQGELIATSIHIHVG